MMRNKYRKNDDLCHCIQCDEPGCVTEMEERDERIKELEGAESAIEAIRKALEPLGMNQERIDSQVMALAARVQTAQKGGE